MFKYFTRLPNAECALCMLILVSLLLENHAIASILFHLTMIVLLPHLWYVLKNGHDKKLTFSWLLATGSAWACTCLSLLIERGNIELSMLQKPMMFSVVLMAFFCMATVKVNRKDFLFITRVNLIASITFPIMYLKYGNGIGKGIFTLCFSNSNLCGMWLLIYVVSAIVSLCFEKNKYIKLISTLILIINSHFLYLSEARNCFISLILCLLLFYCFKNKIRKPFNSVTILIIALFPLIFAFIYLTTVNIIQKSGYFDFFTSEGKDLDSRVEIWNHLLDRYFDNPIIGCFGKMPYMFQGHNSHIDILCMGGVVTFISTVYFLYHILVRLNSNILCMKQFVVFLAFLSSMLLGMGEASLFVGAGGLYVSAAIYIYLSRIQTIHQ